MAIGQAQLPGGACPPWTTPYQQRVINDDTGNHEIQHILQTKGITSSIAILASGPNTACTGARRGRGGARAMGEGAHHTLALWAPSPGGWPYHEHVTCPPPNHFNHDIDYDYTITRHKNTHRCSCPSERPAPEGPVAHPQSIHASSGGRASSSSQYRLTCEACSRATHLPLLNEQALRP